MQNKQLDAKIQQAETSLLRKLNWIGRHDTRVAYVTGICLAMLGVLAHASAVVTRWDVTSYIVFGSTAVLLFICLLLIYCSQYPKTESRNSSLAFFGTIAALKLDEFKKRFRERTDEEYLDDLLSQIHINAEILNKKFCYLKMSLIVLVIAVIPWAGSIYLSKLYIK